MDPIRTLFSRRAFSRLAYWLSALGYDVRDRSTTNRVYLVYFCLFWLVWVIAVLALIGDRVSTGFNFLPEGLLPEHLVVQVGQYLLAAWLLFELRRVLRRSPFIFNEEDAYLLCQTPVSRRKVAVALFLLNFTSICFVAAAGTLIACFSLTEWHLQDAGLIQRLLDAIISSLRALLNILPLFMGIQAFLWGLSALRLTSAHTPRWTRWVFPVVTLIFLASFLHPALHHLLMTPLRMPFDAAFKAGEAAWWSGLVPAILFLAAGWVNLLAQSGKIILSRAAQETRDEEAIRLARSYGQNDIAETLINRRKLVASQPAVLLSMRTGIAILPLKALLQARRTFKLTQVFDWLTVFGLTLAIFLPANTIFQLVMACLWTLRIAPMITRRLRGDLSRWWLLRSLPFRANELLLAELAPAWGLCVLASWLALAFAGGALITKLEIALLLPLLSAAAALSTGADILRRSKARVLMSAGTAEENVAQQGMGGVLRGLISVLLPLGVFLLASTSLAHLLAFPLALLAVWINYQEILSAYRWME